jgi:Fe-S-cluster-containing hydrogenase component 2
MCLQKKHALKMKSVLNFLWFSLVAQSVTAQVARPVADTCLPHYRLSRAEVANCQITKNDASPFLIEMTLLGKSLADGFRFNWNPNQMNGHFSTVLFADNGTTTPLAGVFQPCPGNWLYFKGSGFRKSVLNANTAEPFQDISFRVRYWGSIQNPDSLKLEYKSNALEGAYVTTRRDSVCDKCLATDKIPPHIINCPTKIIELPMPADPTKVNGDHVMSQVGIKVTDNCGVYNATNYPHLISVIDGQIVDYHTIAYDPSGNRSDCRFKVKFHSPLADTCLAKFKLDHGSLGNCKMTPTNAPFRQEIQLLGKQIKDGFTFYIQPNLMNGRNGTFITGKNGTTVPPPGSSFSACAGTWVYFKATGYRKQLYVNPDAKELENIIVRIKHFGDERNPDSLWVEFAEPLHTVPHFVSVKKDTVCNKCLATDKTPPKISNCPTSVISYPLPQPQIPLRSEQVVSHAGIQISDNCQISSSNAYPYRIDVPKIGQVIDYKLVVYDESGNMSICQFKVKIVAPTPTLADTCQIRFQLSYRETQTCESATSLTRPNLSVTMLGNQIADGFKFTGGRSGNVNYLVGKNGQKTQPVGAQYNTCAGDWTYFTAIGVFTGTRPPTGTELTNIQVRIKHFGNERNPDSLRLEFAKNNTFETGMLYNSFRKDTICSPCLITDKVAPQIINCPTQLVNYPITNEWNVFSTDVMKFAKISASDNCELSNLTTFPYQLTGFQAGQIVDYKTVAYDGAGNKSVCQFKTKFVSPPNDMCFALFNLKSSTPGCDGVSLGTEGNGMIQLLGKRIADGIKISSSTSNPIGSASSQTVYFGKNGSTTPPAGSNYSVCSGNWTYFILSGWTHRFTIHQTTQTETTNLHVRVKYFGNESNPDSLRIEYSGLGFLNTSTKQTYCNNCVATDKIAPVISHCPTQIVPVTNTGIIMGDDVARAAFTVTDNCQLENVSTYPYEVRSVKNGQIIDFHTVAYDQAGNKSVCQFKVQVIAPVATPAKLVENQSVAFEIQGINPNPTDGALTVTLESNQAKEVTFDFYNSLGEKAHSVTKQVQKGANSLFFDVTKLATGIYFIQTSELGDNKATIKVVKY